MKTNSKLCADSKYEQARLKREFPREKDIYKCKRGNKVCYVKGRLQPTRSFGDLTLKYKEFNNPENKSRHQGYRSSIKDFSGPYISYLPVIKVFSNNKEDQNVGLVIGTDGLWDEMSKSEVLETIIQNQKYPLSALLNKSLENAAKSSNISLKTLKKIPLGKSRRRSYHDDISMVYINLA
jgi:pyruvate dehydrogenase phosphatase